MRIFRQSRGNMGKIRIALYLLFIGMIGFSLLSDTAFSGTYTVHNDITADGFQVSGTRPDDSGGYEFYEITDRKDRTYTQVKIMIDLSHTDGLDHLQAQIWHMNDADTSNVGTVGENAAAKTMSQGSEPTKFVATFDVRGWGYGYYRAKVRGVPTTHTEKVDEYEHPDWGWYQSMLQETDEISLNDAIKAGMYPDIDPAVMYLDDGMVEVYEEKNDVDIMIQTHYQDFYLLNPAKDMNVDFSISQQDQMAPVSFDFSVVEGNLKGVTMTLYKTNYDTRVKSLGSVSEINNFVFNAEGGQSDAEYIAKVHYVGTIGWNGGSVEKKFIVDNPDTIDGLVTLYIQEGGTWVEAEETLSGTVKVEVTNVIGNIQRMYVEIKGPNSQEHTLSEISESEWSTTFDTKSLVNGAYEINVIAIREEDDAICYLSAFSLNREGGTDQTNILIFAMGIIGLTAMILTERRVSEIIGL